MATLDSYVNENVKIAIPIYAQTYKVSVFSFQMAIIIITTTINFSLGGETACLCQNLEPFGYELVEHPSLQLD